MKQFLQQVLLGLTAVSVLGCSDISMPSMPSMPSLNGMLGGKDGGYIHVTENKPANSDAQSLKYAASIRINRYTDARRMGNPRKIGTGAEFVSGMSGNDLVLDQEVAEMVTVAMKTRLDDAGFQVSETQNGNAPFELSGVVKELTYNVKARDEVSITIETTLKETGTGKAVWSGSVVEKGDRFAGVSGNNKNDVAIYLRKELGIVTAKTAEAISTVLMAARPDLFNQRPGTKNIPGVTVLTAPESVNTPILPAQQAAPIPAENAAQTYVPHATATSGLLLVNTRPARARIYLDDVYYGLSPLRLEMEPGVHAISIKMEGYKTVLEKVSVRKGDNTEMDTNLEHQ